MRKVRRKQLAKDKKDGFIIEQDILDSFEEIMREVDVANDTFKDIKVAPSELKTKNGKKLHNMVTALKSIKEDGDKVRESVNEYKSKKMIRELIPIFGIEITAFNSENALKVGYVIQDLLELTIKVKELELDESQKTENTEKDTIESLEKDGIVIGD